MTEAQLTELVGLFARYTRLCQMKKRTKADNAELYMLRQKMLELGLETLA